MEKLPKLTSPNLIRTSTLPSDFIRQHLDIVNTPILLDVGSEITQMQLNWCKEEEQEERRLVRLLVHRESYATFKILAEPVSPFSYSSNDDSLVISCIKWKEKDICVVTSVDVILVLEFLVGEHFSIEEKSRVRRNLQFLKPYTVTKSSNESRRLFSSLMSMENPRPRNIEKGLKVFEWSDLFVAVNRVLSKYSANPENMSAQNLTTTNVTSNDGEPPKTELSTLSDLHGKWYPRPDQNASCRNAPIHPQSSVTPLPSYTSTILSDIARQTRFREECRIRPRWQASKPRGCPDESQWHSCGPSTVC